jgi:hypothetical protein
MYALSRALSGMSNQTTDILDYAARQKKQNDAALAAQSAKEGKAKADEAAVTGTVDHDWLATANQFQRQAYEETDGLNAANRFEQQFQPELAKLEPGADIDQVMQQHVATFVEESQLPEEARKAFMVAMAQKQPSIKEAFLKQSIAEGQKREEEGYQAYLVDGLRTGHMLDPSTLGAWRDYGLQKGLTEDQIEHSAVTALKAAMASGDIDLAKGKTLLETPMAPGRTPLASIPEHAEELRNAASVGQHIQDERAQKARYDQEVAETVQIDALADKGILGSARATAWGKANDKSAAEVAAKIRQSAEARERLAEKAQKAAEQRRADLAWMNHDALREQASGIKPEDVSKAGDRALTAALQKGETSPDVMKVLEHSARTGAPIPALKTLLGSIDENDPSRAERYVGIFEHMQNISPSWAAQQVDDKTLARITQYQQARALGATGTQAWSQVKMGSSLDTETINKNVTEAMKAVDKAKPKDFDAPHFWQSDTPIANITEMDAAYRLRVRNMVQQGIPPNVAAKTAIERVKAEYVRVGDRLVRSYGTGDGVETQTSDAMTEASVMWKDRLVAQNVVGKDDPVWFVPVPGSPDKWRLKYFAAGGVPLDVTHEITVDGPDGKPQKKTAFVDVIPSATRENYSVWKKQEDDKRVRNAQAFTTFGQPDEELTADAAKRLQVKLGQQATSIKPGDTSGYALDPANRKRAEGAAKLQQYVQDPTNHVQSFADFITSQH